jgi:REP element-mobilizing transposase RayT
MAVLADHVHVLVSFRPDTQLSDFIRLAKTISAFRANARVPGAVRWARGFFVASLHRRGIARVDEYIARQYEHHPDRIPALKRVLLR